MNEIMSILDTIEAKYWHISATSSFYYGETSKDQRALYDAQLAVLRDVAWEVKRAMLGDTDDGSGAILERRRLGMLVVEMGGQMTAFVHDSAAAAERAKLALETEHAGLDASDWQAQVCAVTVPARDRDTFAALDVRHVLIIYRDGAFWPTVHNTVIELQEAIDEFEYLRSDPFDNNVEVFTSHRILIPHDGRGGHRATDR